MMNFGGKPPIFDYFSPMENLPKKGSLSREFWAQKPTHMGGTYPFPQHDMYPPWVKTVYSHSSRLHSYSYLKPITKLTSEYIAYGSTSRQLRPRLHEIGSKWIRIQIVTDRPCVYTGHDGSELIWICYPYPNGITFESDPVRIRSQKGLV